MASSNPRKRKIDDPFLFEETVEESAVSYKLASMGTRFGAQILDHIFVGFVSSFFIVLLGFLGATFSFVMYFLYHVFFWTLNDGQTLGKLIMGIRVVKANGAQLTIVDGFIRYVGYMINNVFPLLWLWAWLSPKKQGLHDVMAGTYVVQVRSARPATITAAAYKAKNGEKRKIR